MNRKRTLIVLGAVALVLVFVTLIAAAGLWIGVTWIRGQMHAGMASSDWIWDGSASGRGYGGPGMMWDNRGYVGPGMMWRVGDQAPHGPTQDMPCAGGSAGPGTMWGGWEAMSCGQEYLTPDGEGVLSLEDAQAAVERTLDRLGYDDLHVTEVMEFEYNFYAIVAEGDTGIGAMELLVDKSNGTVGTEPGPNMMWNAEYGMHGGGRMGMMGGFVTGEMTVSPEEAEELAQRWLDANLPGRTAGEADPFYGYYTLHFLQDGQIEGMVSIHGGSGDVWFHSWHGDFVAMTGEHE